MATIEECVKELIDERYGSVPRLAAAIDLPAQTIYSALRNGLKGSSMSTVMPIVEALDIDPGQLVRGNLVMLSGKKIGSVKVPMFGSIAAGLPAEPDVADNMLPIPIELHDKYPDAFLLRVQGESMNNILPNGCFALVDPCVTVDYSNQPYALSIGMGNAMVKRVRVLDNGFELKPDSSDPTFRSTILDFADPTLEPVTIIGRVVWYCLPAQWDFYAQ
ncbi:MAG TPA: hypothetical protein DCP91_07795 [Eggerthellaceae bacterium]|nr:hypothetical protein [Eggerthellaceae bacterium]